MQTVNLLPLLGVLIVAIGFLFRFNPVISILISAIVTGVAANNSTLDILALIGSGFIKTRNLSFLVIMPLAIIGLMEKHGLRERAQALISKFANLTVSRLLITYLFLRQLTASIGLAMFGGQAQMVRPLLAPMIEEIARKKYPKISSETLDLLKAHSAACDNIGLFFGEDIFVAFGAVILMTTFLHEFGIHVEPIHVALWGIPTALCIFVAHAYRLYLLDRQLKKIAAVLQETNNDHN